MSKEEFNHSGGFIVNHVNPDVPIAASDDKLSISVNASGVATFAYTPGTSPFASQWAAATGTYQTAYDQITGTIAHSSDPGDGQHPFVISIDRSVRWSNGRPHIQTYIGPRPSGGTPDDGSWTGHGGPPPQ